MFKNIKNIREISVFAGGVLFGTAGLSILASKDAKRAYAHVVAAALRAKDALMTKVTVLRENTGDIIADARDINAKRAEQTVVVLDESEND